MSCKPKYKSGSDQRIGTDIILVSTDQNQGKLHIFRSSHRHVTDQTIRVKTSTNDVNILLLSMVPGMSNF